MKSFREIRNLADRGNVIPLFERIASDLDTPVSVYLKLAAKRTNTFLLESIEGGEKLARYSFIGFDPFLIIEGSSDHLLVRSGRYRERIDAEPIPFLKELFKVYRPVRVEGLPRFTGGGVGYFAYDTIRWIERIPDRHPQSVKMPEMLLGLYRQLVVFDHLRQEMLLVSNILHEGGGHELRARYDDAVDEIEKMKRLLKKRVIEKSIDSSSKRASVRCNTSRDEFKRMVSKAKRYIREGDVFQVVLSRRWEIRSDVSPLSVYRRLRRSNPSPYMFLLTFDDSAVIGSSPEMMVRVDRGEIETRPIAGTRPRGKTEAEDERLAADLLSDPKELAEHTMLLDLGRNDLGRVSIPGSVRVKLQMTIEKYSHVMHIVSSVVGKLDRKLKPIDGHFASFPAGTVSGAPKIRAMEIIDELEKERRGIYAGSIAYLDFWGNLDSCIAIRTVVYAGGTYFVQAGAGIVADSKPLRECEETEAKAAAIIQAVTGERLR